MTKSRQANDSVHGDRPLRKGEIDRLGFREVAARIATALTDHDSNDGFVIGLEGRWGSGKSSLLHLMQAELEAVPTDPPTVVNFRPWLLGNRDALLLNLFNEFATSIDRYQSPKSDKSKSRDAKVAQIAKAMRTFGNQLSKWDGIVELAGEYSGIPGGKAIGKILSKSSNIFANDQKSRPLVELKDQLSESLRDLGHRFIVTIDDVDRLEPSEVVEVMRLVRSVADFPNVIYILCYDSDVLKHSVEKIAQTNDGKAFIEKIIQLTVMVPQPEPFVLRQWFMEELRIIAEPKNEDELERLKLVVDLEGGKQLVTPRSVVRALDSIRFFWPSLRNESADLSDLVWLVLIMSGNPSLYRWIENYCANAALVSLGTARVEEAERKMTASKLFNCVERDSFRDAIYRHQFAEQLPGVTARFDRDDGDPLEIYGDVRKDELDEAILNKRLKSPDHYRIYFALSGPSYALTQADFDSLWRAVYGGVSGTASLLRDWNLLIVSGSMSKAEILFERLLGAQSISDAQSRNLLLALGQFLDDAYFQHPKNSSWDTPIWSRAEKLLRRLLESVDANERESVIFDLFGEGTAIGWLTSQFRHETFAQGRYGQHRKPTDSWILTAAELDRVTAIMVERYRGMTIEKILSSPSPLDILFAWRQAGYEDEPRRLAESQCESDASLIRLLEAMIGQVHSSNRGRYDVLRRENLDPFLDFEHVVARLASISGASQDREIASRAAQLTQLIENSRTH